MNNCIKITCLNANYEKVNKQLQKKRNTCCQEKLHHIDMYHANKFNPKDFRGGKIALFLGH